MYAPNRPRRREIGEIPPHRLKRHVELDRERVDARPSLRFDGGGDLGLSHATAHRR